MLSPVRETRPKDRQMTTTTDTARSFYASQPRVRTADIIGAKRTGPIGDMPGRRIAQRTMIGVDPDEIVLGDNASRSDTRDSAIHSLARSMREHGQQHPIRVARMGDSWVAVSGNNRVIAARYLNAHLAQGETPFEIQCSIVNLSREQDPALQAAILNIVENMQRTGLTPLEQARAMRLLIEAGRTQSVIAEIFACTQASVSNTLALLRLHPRLVLAVERGQLGATDAVKIGRGCPSLDEQAALGEEILAGHLTGKAALAKATGAEPAFKKKQARALARVLAASGSTFTAEDVEALVLRCAGIAVELTAPIAGAMETAGI